MFLVDAGLMMMMVVSSGGVEGGEGASLWFFWSLIPLKHPSVTWARSAEEAVLSVLHTHTRKHTHTDTHCSCIMTHFCMPLFVVQAAELMIWFPPGDTELLREEHLHACRQTPNWLFFSGDTRSLLLGLTGDVWMVVVLRCVVLQI